MERSVQAIKDLTKMVTVVGFETNPKPKKYGDREYIGSMYLHFDERDVAVCSVRVNGSYGYYDACEVDLVNGKKLLGSGYWKLSIYKDAEGVIWSKFPKVKIKSDSGEEIWVPKVRFVDPRVMHNREDDGLGPNLVEAVNAATTKIARIMFTGQNVMFNRPKFKFWTDGSVRKQSCLSCKHYWSMRTDDEGSDLLTVRSRPVGELIEKQFELHACCMMRMFNPMGHAVELMNYYGQMDTDVTEGIAGWEYKEIPDPDDPEKTTIEYVLDQDGRRIQRWGLIRVGFNRALYRERAVNWYQLREMVAEDEAMDCPSYRMNLMTPGGWRQAKLHPEQVQPFTVVDGKWHEGLPKDHGKTGQVVFMTGLPIGVALSDDFWTFIKDVKTVKIEPPADKPNTYIVDELARSSDEIIMAYEDWLSSLIDENRANKIPDMETVDAILSGLEGTTPEVSAHILELAAELMK